MSTSLFVYSGLELWHCLELRRLLLHGQHAALDFGVSLPHGGVLPQRVPDLYSRLPNTFRLLYGAL